MKQLLLIFLFLLLNKLSAQTRLEIDTNNLQQDSFFFYFSVPGDTCLKFKDYKYQYKYKNINKKSIDKVFKFDGCKAHITANQDSITFILISDLGPKCFKFILWLDDIIYVVYVDSYKMTKVCRIDESHPAGCQKTPRM